MICLFLPLFILSFLFNPVSTLQPKDVIQLAVNKIAPYHNPTESYRYYDLPFCRPKELQEVPQTLGEKLTGNRKMVSGYEVEFAVSTKKRSLCKEVFNSEQLQQFRVAISKNYIFEMFIDEFIVGNMIGYVKENRYYLANHLNFNILYNKALGRIIRATVDYDYVKNTIDITTNSSEIEIEFTYSVRWHETSLESPTINNGFDSFFVDEIHWFSFLNALLLTGLFVTLIWRIIHRIQKTELITTSVDIECEWRDDDLNWKMIRADIFKLPDYYNVLCASVGNGISLVLITVCLLILGFTGRFYHYRGYVITCAIILYIICSFVGGYVSAKYFKYLGGDGWIYNVVMTGLLIPLPSMILIGLLNTFAIAQNSAAKLPISSVLYLFIIFVFLGLPLLFAGSVVARLTQPRALKEIRENTHKGPKNIPELPFYHSPMFTVVIAGIFPFSSMHVELYYLFSSIWGHKVYTMYGMIFIIFVMILNMTACISIILTYFQLNALDSRWWWRSFFYGGSSAFYVFLYSLYFLLKKTEMDGFLQISYYIGYSALLSFCIFLMMGSVGFIASSAFVRQIYERSKID